MTTKDSPRGKLKAQADNIAKTLKGFIRGKIPPGPFTDKLRESLDKPGIKFAVVMDDKVLKMEMPWSVIRETDERGISEWIVSQMSEEPSP